jgi:hypothetical protein
MNLPAGIPRSRGAICGVVLVLLGLWGGLAPFVGPYFHFGLLPDKAWHYDSGRLYYSVVPAAAALLGGLLALVTRSRAIGAIGGLLGVLGGAWFALGQDFVTVVLKQTSITVAAPIGTPALAGATEPVRMYLEQLSLFGGLGVLTAAVGALAIGRFSMVAAKDMALDEEESYAPRSPISAAPMRVAATAVSTFPSEADQYSPTGTFTRPSSGPPPAFFQESQASFPDAPTQFPEPTQ